MSSSRAKGLNHTLENDLCSSGMLRSVDGYLVTDVSRQNIGPIFKAQSVQVFLCRWTHNEEDFI
jgi:hypothetical protein